MSLLTNVLKLWRTGQYLLPADSGFMVKHLFANSEPGAWYDPSDLSTLFQDSAGTIPVTAVEQPVGLMLDKTKPIVLNGAERMNVLPSEAANWAGGDNTVVGNKIIPNTTNGYHGQYRGIPSTGLDCIIKVKAKAAGYSKFYISDAGYGRVRAAYDLANGTVISAASNIPHDAAIVHLGDGVYELSVKVNAVTSIALAITPYPDTGATLSPYYASFAGDGVSGAEVYAVDARLVTHADALPRYQYTPANTWSRFIGSTHATQSTSTKRPVYSRRVNLLTKTEQFDDGVWVKDAGLVTPAAYTSPTGQVFTKYTPDMTAVTNHRVRQTRTVPAGVPYTLSFDVKAAGYTGIKLRATGAWVNFNLTTGAVGNSANVSSPTITSLDDGIYRVSATFSVGASICYIYVDPSDTASPDTGAFAGDGTSGIYFRRASLTLATDAHLPYQWVNTDTDYDADPAKFPGYLRFDGVDDALQTGNIDFTGTDKMTVWAGISHYRSSGSQYIVSNLNGQTTPLFVLYSADTQSILYLNTSGELDEVAGPSRSSFSGVLTGVIGDKMYLRENGEALVANRVGSAALGNVQLHIGQIYYGGSYFNGRLYSLIVPGAQSSLSQIEATENLIRKTMRLP